MIIAPPTFQRLQIVAVVLGVTLASGPVLAQSSRLSETTIPPSGAATILRDPPRAAPAASSPPIARPPVTTVTVPTVPATTVATAPAAAAQLRPPIQKTNYFPYLVKPGDSLSGLAIRFDIPHDELAKVNRLPPDAQLIESTTLRIPNPFAAQVKSLTAQVQQLSAAVSGAENQAREAESRLRTSRVESQQALLEVQALRQGAEMLPWWRAAALGLGAVAILMFGVMAVTLFEWWRMRRRFVVLAEMAETLGRLDHKYKAMLAKAELRLQQLYGRRRQGMTEGQPRPKLQEEVEIERLNVELKEVLAHHLERLGPRSERKRGRGRIRDIVGDLESPVDARTTAHR
jgi:murein DD-endopeptidase MepM/ murein hydrolase activator NlpD